MAESRIRATYDTVAMAYDTALRDELAGKPVDRALLDALLELCPGIVADVGCGPGHVTRYLAARHRAVVGVDLSPAMVEIARGAVPALSFEVGRTKPDPEGLLLLAERHGVDPGRILFIGDKDGDRECAEQAGAAFLHVEEIGVDWRRATNRYS